MQQPAMNPLPSIIFFVVAIWLIAKSSKRFQTLLRMVTAFLVTAGVFLVPNAILRIGDPRAWGRLAGLVAMLVAAIAGWMHVRSLRSAPPAHAGKITAASLARSEKLISWREKQPAEKQSPDSVLGRCSLGQESNDEIRAALPDARPEIINFPGLRREIRQRVERRSRRKARLPIRAEVMFSR